MATMLLCVEATWWDVPQGYRGKLLGAVVQPWGLCFGIQVDFFDCRNYRTRNQGRFFLAVETTELETKVQNPYLTLGKSCTNSWISYRIVVAYKNPIIEALFHPKVYMQYTPTARGGSLMREYIYAHGAKRVDTYKSDSFQLKT